MARNSTTEKQSSVATRGESQTQRGRDTAKGIQSRIITQLTGLTNSRLTACCYLGARLSTRRRG